MDLPSAVLRELRLESAAYRWLELGAPFRMGFDQPGLRGVHIIARGECEVVLDDGTVDRLTAGDLVIFPRGDSHVLRSPGTGSGSTVSGFELAMRTPGTRLRAGGQQSTPSWCAVRSSWASRTTLSCAGCPAASICPVTPAARRPGSHPLIEALSAEAFDGGPGSDLVMARLSDALLIRALRHHSDTVEQPGWLAGLRDPYVATALAAIHAGPARPWTLTILASTIGLSRAAFAARFADRVGEPAMRYLPTRRDTMTPRKQDAKCPLVPR